MINIPKGTKDVLPSDSYRWQYIESVARQTAQIFNAREIRTPVFEHTELFLRSVGETTDIVGKEMYTFLDKGNRSVTLKPEGTAGVVRSFLENGLFNETMPLKTFYFTPVFRYERPQSGRLREHHQFGVEIFGSTSAEIDAELISLANQFLTKIGIKNLTVSINSVGCKECRGQYNKALKEFYGNNIDKLCPVCRERLEKNPLRILDCKEPDCAELNKNAPKIMDYLCEECSTHFAEVCQKLTDFGINYEIDQQIVRGLDYYTKTVFEFVSSNLGAKSTVCGGGRYDNLCEYLGDKKVPAAGFGLGIERLLILLDNLQIEIPKPNGVEYFFAGIGEVGTRYAQNLCQKFRAKGIASECDSMNRSLKAQLKYADKLQAKFVVVVGEDEIANNKFFAKNMVTGKESVLEL